MKAKLINETLDNFEKKSDPLISLGVGKKALITKWLDEMNIKSYKINSDFSIDTQKGVDLNKKNLIKLPDYIKFNKVNGYFDLLQNHLISLKGSPEIVESIFCCAYNDLETLEGCPKYAKTFQCWNNKKQFTKEYVTSLCKANTIIV